MTVYERLLMDSATLRIIEQILKEHENATMADAAKDDKKCISEIRKTVAARYNEK